MLGGQSVKTLLNHSILACGIVIVSHCAAPSEPSSLQSSGVNRPQTGDAVGQGGAKFGAQLNYGGAAVGDQAMQAQVTKCVSQGKFYDRKSTTCTNFPLASRGCTLDAVKDSMTPDRKVQFTALLNGSLAGYLVDQCLDCSKKAKDSDPNLLALCEGVSAQKQTAPGYRLFLVKPESTQIQLQSIFIAD
jgi:hypothetical protein